MSGKVALCHQGQLQCGQRGGNDVPGNGLAQHFRGNAVRLGDGQGFAQTLHHGGGDHVGDQFDDGAGSNASQMQDVPGTVLQHGAYAVQSGGIRSNVVNQFPFSAGKREPVNGQSTYVQPMEELIRESFPTVARSIVEWFRMICSGVRASLICSNTSRQAFLSFR